MFAFLPTVLILTSDHMCTAFSCYVFYFSRIFVGIFDYNSMYLLNLIFTVMMIKQVDVLMLLEVNHLLKIVLVVT